MQLPRFTIDMIDWRGRPLSEKEQLVLREAAADLVRVAGFSMRFTSEVLKGSIFRMGEGRFYRPGTYFRAYLDEEGGASRECTFLLPRGSEAVRHLASEPIPEPPVDPALALETDPSGSEKSPPREADQQQWAHFVFSADMPKPTVAEGSRAVN